MHERTLAVCALASLGLASEAHAYCRTTTVETVITGCPEDCQKEGKPLFWTTPDLHYTFNVNGFPDLDDEDLRRIFAASTAPWEEVACDDEPIGFTLSARDYTTELARGPRATEPNENAIAYLELDAWQAEDLGDLAYATTQVWFVPSTGKLIGADMLFNGSMGPFGECTDSGCSARGPRVDLQNVATHEFGHFLGLAHSEEPDATMFCNAVPRDIEKRTLAADDVEGLCAAYPPAAAFVEPKPRKKKKDGCALGGEASAGWLMFVFLLRRRRR